MMILNQPQLIRPGDWVNIWIRNDLGRVPLGMSSCPTYPYEISENEKLSLLKNSIIWAAPVLKNDISNQKIQIISPHWDVFDRDTRVCGYWLTESYVSCWISYDCLPMISNVFQSFSPCEDCGWICLQRCYKFTAIKSTYTPQQILSKNT